MFLNIKILRQRLRENIIRILLFAIGFRVYASHWVYSKYLNINSNVVDLGANLGDFSSLIYKKYKCTPFLVEPNPRLCKSLEQREFEVLNYAVSDKNTEIDFYLSKNNEASSIIKDFQKVWSVEKLIKVKSVTLDNLFDLLNLKNKEIELIKIDIEGAELELFESISFNDVKNIKQITVEFHHRLNDKLTKRTHNVIEKIKKFGFVAIENKLSQEEILFINLNKYKFNNLQDFFFKIYKKIKFYSN